ncbi:MAG: hypothetical protein CENE_03802 [Candidatus Celerinatantimonas neptuna]|nr:MAG: hypothetical protein CENE_03802 [Candidatus Celerinatantimonas neptuna]
MSSNTYFRAPSEFVQVVIESLEQSLKLSIGSSYRRVSVDMNEPMVSYLIGEIETKNETSNDGRKQHEIELRFLVEVPTSIEYFDLEAMDLSTRLQRELMLQSFGCSADLNESRLISNLPSRFDPDHGVLGRTVTMKQVLMMGPIEEDWLEIEGADGYVDGANKPDTVIRADGAAASAGN